MEHQRAYVKQMRFGHILQDQDPLTSFVEHVIGSALQKTASQGLQVSNKSAVECQNTLGCRDQCMVVINWC